MSQLPLRTPGQQRQTTPPKMGRGQSLPQKAGGTGQVLRESSGSAREAPAPARPGAPNQHAQRQGPSGANAAATQPNVSKSAKCTPAPRKTGYKIVDYEAINVNVLYEELHKKYPGQTWFDSYGSLGKLKSATTLSSSAKTKKTTYLADLPLLVGEKGNLGLYDAVWDTISYLLDVDATENPVTEINNKPQGCTSALWNGKLWLGGIKDSMNLDFLEKDKKGTKPTRNPNGIDAVVSIHPKDRLTQKWAYIFDTWDGVRGLRPRGTGDKPIQYLIELKDDYNEPLAAYFEKAFKFMDYYLSQGQNVLVHCKMGQSRSASLLLAYMVTKCYKLGMHTSPAFGRSRDASDVDRLAKALQEFTREVQRKRDGVSTKKFDAQLLQYFERLTKSAGSGKSTNTPTGQPNPIKKKGGGGILCDAILALCFLHDLKPTPEIMGHWVDRRKGGSRYWTQACKDKFLGKEVDENRFHKYFDSYLTK